MRRFIIIFSLLAGFSATAHSQFLNLSDLVGMIKNGKTESATTFLGAASWSLTETETDEAKGLRYDTWSYGIDYSEYYDEYSSVPPAYLNLISQEGAITGL